VHDTTALEERGIPAVFVASEEFRQAAAAQARSLGSPDRAVFVAHPIQDRTDEEMRELAERAVDQILAGLLVPAEGGEPSPTKTI
jgi:alkanesulfonate monooxygenase SsuD/methylene tetrahydromethanopterin reductase-like flavin-dependent oxidoreductase (luciferase family)